MSTTENTSMKKSRAVEKLVFVLTTAAIVFLSNTALWVQWLLPYFYVIVTPLLIGVRLVMYWRNKWQYFLLDFCYFVNLAVLLFLCLPQHVILFTVMFALANGPIIWAIIAYRNSLVLHSLDKVTSTYIHVLPPLISFVVRWYPTDVSAGWFKSFVPEQLECSPLWLYLVPLACYVAHSAFYSLVINFLVRPSDEFITSYSYLGEKDGSFLFTLFNCCGPKFRCGMFYIWNWIFCGISLIGALLCYQFYVVHCVVLVFLCTVAVWNGACYYTDVFSVRGFVKELE